MQAVEEPQLCAAPSQVVPADTAAAVGEPVAELAAHSDWVRVCALVVEVAACTDCCAAPVPVVGYAVGVDVVEPRAAAVEVVVVEAVDTAATELVVDAGCSAVGCSVAAAALERTRVVAAVAGAAVVVAAVAVGADNVVVQQETVGSHAEQEIGTAEAVAAAAAAVAVHNQAAPIAWVCRTAGEAVAELRWAADRRVVAADIVAVGEEADGAVALGLAAVAAEAADPNQQAEVELVVAACALVLAAW